MKKITCFLILLLILSTLMPGFAGAGNGAPTGAHFNLNIIGVSNDKSESMDSGSGHVIFVPLVGTSKIMLTEGEYGVIDKNGTDGSASFMLPNPDPDNNGVTEYSVFARALGKPGGASEMTTGATYIDPDTGEELVIMSIISAEFNRSNGKQTFVNVSKELLYIYADYDFDGDLDRVNLFNSALEDYFWKYDNNGLKVLQLRFYPIPTEVPDPGEL